MSGTDHRPSLFLSSTASDLSEFREAVIHVCYRLGIDVIAMEEFGPDPRTAAELCQSKIGGADLFLGLYAYRYGHTPDGFDGASITELEYSWAMARNPPPDALLFLVDEDFRWPPKDIDRGSASERLDQFKSRLRARHVVSKLTTPEQLREDLFVHLPKFRNRAGQAGEPTPLAVMPVPPEPYVVHQYTLLQTGQVIGRESELQALDAWVQDANSELAAARVLCVVAIGGMGKSALTWKWFHERAPRAMAPLAGRFWWSFYESDAGFDRFIMTALAYCSGRAPQEVAALSPVDRENQLLALLDLHQFLLVLDGLERVLIAYSNLDFAHLADEDLDTRTANAVAGKLGLPQEAGVSFIGQHRLRKTIDPRAGTFLRKLAHVRAARILVTTRLYPSELQTVTGHEIPGTAALFLRGLTSEDALALWRAMGVSGTDAELTKLFSTIDHYPLLIRALAGEVAGYRPAPGKFDEWRRSHHVFNPFALPLVQAKSHVLAHALGSLDAGAREVLHTIAAFRAPVGYDTLAALFIERRHWPAHELDAVLSALEDRGVVGWDRKSNHYDLHPIVRGVVWSGLDDMQRQEVYGSLEEHFSALPSGKEGANTIEEALPMIELFTALVGLGRHDAASDIYFERIHMGQFSFVDVGMQHVNISMLESLFPDGLDGRPKTSKNVLGVFAQLGSAYRLSGRLIEARSCFLRQRQEAETLGESDDLRGIAHGNVGAVAVVIGNLKEALEFAEIEVRYRSRDYTKYAISRFASYEAITGDVESATKRLVGQRADKFYDPSIYLALIGMRQGHYKKSEAVAERWLGRSQRIYERLPASLLLAEARINLGRTAAALVILNDVLRESRTKNLVEYELQSLRCLAELHRRLGDFAQSRTFLEDLAEPAARGPYRLIQADAANILAELERDCGNRDAAIEAAREAQQLAWCDGPPYSYHWALEHAKRLLREFGVD